MDWNNYLFHLFYSLLSHSPCGSVDWNLFVFILRWPLATSLPLRECGLKFNIGKRILNPLRVTPLAGVWIEIVNFLLTSMLCVCHSPCGSVDWNDISVVFSWWIAQSLPLRECGLKLRCITSIGDTAMSLPLRECGLKFCNSVYLTLIVCHSPCGSVDWNNCRYKHRYKHRYSHSPCGSVDWNIVIPNKIQLVVVTPLAGVWIEIPL